LWTITRISLKNPGPRAAGGGVSPRGGVAVLGADWAGGQMMGATPAARAVSGGKAALMRRGVKTVDLTIVVPQRYAKTLGKAVEEFRLKTGITVKDMLVVSERDVLRRMRAEATSKAGRLDLFLAPSTGIPEGVESRALLPLDDLIRVWPAGLERGRPRVPEPGPIPVEDVRPVRQHGSPGFGHPA